MAIRAEVKKDLQELLEAMEDFNLDAAKKVQQMLLALKEIINSPLQPKTDSVAVPKEFKCPLSNKLMLDPVIISTGQTYDRPSIERWLQLGIRLCPRSDEALFSQSTIVPNPRSDEALFSQSTIIPNHLIRDLIIQWCNKHGIDLFKSLLEKMSSTLSEQRAAAEQLHRITKLMPSMRPLFLEIADAIPQLVAPLIPQLADPLSAMEYDDEVHLDLQEHIIATLFNISRPSVHTKQIAESPWVIPILIDAVKSRKVETRINAAAALFGLSSLDSNKILIGKSGALKPLIDLLNERPVLVIKDAASAIFQLCKVLENRVKAVECGAVEVLLNKIKSKVNVGLLVTILAMISDQPNALEKMIELDAASCISSITGDTSIAAEIKETCAVILQKLTGAGAGAA